MIDKLKKQIRGEVYSDEITRRIYSIDASIYQQEPQVVLVPRSREDIQYAVQWAAEQGLPVTARGAATGINGACLGPGLIVDCSKYLTKILEVNLEEGYALCQPGVIQDQLNRALAPYSSCLGPDTSTGSRATIGGMLGNNSAGAHSIRYGKMVDHVLATDLIMSDGECGHFSEETAESFRKRILLGDRQSKVYQTLQDHVRTQEELIQKSFPQIQRRVSGYNLDEMIQDFPINTAKLIVGSEGSFGMSTEIKVKISPKPSSTVLSVMHFKDFFTAFSCLDYILSHNPFSVEMMDDQVLAMGKKSPSMRGQLDWLKGMPKVLLAVEFDADTPGEALMKQKLFEKGMKAEVEAYHYVRMNDKRSQAKVWNVRKAGLGLLMSRRTSAKPVAFLEDVAVSPQKLAPFIGEFEQYLKAQNKEAGFYGHAGVGCLHVRPILNLKEEEEIDLMYKMMDDISDVLKSYGGAVSGEHGDGLTRSWLNEKMFGSDVYNLFKKVKTAFDPKGLMNPDKIISTQHPRPLLRAPQSVPSFKPKTMYNFDKEGGLNFAVEMCNGNAECRNPQGQMCPSFQAFGDEQHSTRARAQSLQAILNGPLSEQGFDNERVKDVLELCLQCKACKSECPSQVDMAKMKSEFLYHYQEKNGYSLRAKMIGHVDRMNKLNSHLPRLSNLVQSTTLVRKILKGIGFTAQRPLPQLAEKRFSTEFEQGIGSRSIILFLDTSSEFNHPEIARAAVEVMHHLDYEVLLPEYHCCGRPLISKGMLREAKQKAKKLVVLLQSFPKDLSIVGLEPSCLFTIKDEYPDLIGGEDAEDIASRCKTIDQFLAEEIEAGRLKFESQSDDELYLHGHCHQRALEGTDHSMTVLKAMSSEVEEIKTTCCGMAGSFGYEKEHYDFSMAIAEKRLFPAIRQCSKDSEIVANGISCRCQIEHGTGRKAKHLIELVAERLHEE